MELSAAIKLGEKLGCQLYVNQVKRAEDTVHLQKDRLKDVTSIESVRYALKAWAGKKSAVLVTEKLGSEAVRAVAAAAKSSKDDYYYGLPGKESWPKPDVFDSAISKMAVSKLIDYAQAIVSEASGGGVHVSQAAAAKSVIERRCVNSNGVDVTSKRTELAVEAEAVCGAESYSDFLAETHKFKIGGFGREMREMLLFYSRAEKLAVTPDAFIVKPNVMSGLFKYAFMDNLNGKNAEMGKSCLSLGKGGLGEATLTNDGLLPRGFHSDRMDFEGHVKQKSVLVNKGAVSAFAYDYNTALNNRHKATGSAGAMGIEFDNIVLDMPYGEASGRVLVIESVVGEHTSNDLTTEFSVSADKCYLIDRGKKIPVAGFMLSGSVLDLLKDARAATNEKEHRLGYYLPDVLTKNLHVARSN